MSVEYWSPYTQSAKFQEFVKIHVTSIFEYIIWPRQKYVPSDIFKMCIFYLELSVKMIVQKTKTQPKKSAAFGVRLLALFWGLKYNHFLRVQDKIYTYWVYLMEHIFSEVQLCTEISIFNEFCEIPTKQNIWELRLDQEVKRKRLRRERSAALGGWP